MVSKLRERPAVLQKWPSAMAGSETSVLAAWSNFYVMAGSAAAALTGLMFVVISVVTGTPTSSRREGVSTFSTPTVVHFSAALLMCATLSAPWHLLVDPAIIIGLLGCYGVFYVLYIFRRTLRITTYVPEAEDWLWYTVVPMLAYLIIIVSALRLLRDPTSALFGIGGATMLLIFLGIRNAWDVVTYVTIVQPETSGNRSSTDTQDAQTAQSSDAEGRS